MCVLASCSPGATSSVQCVVVVLETTSAIAEGIFYHQGTQAVEKSFNPTWVGALHLYSA